MTDPNPREMKKAAYRLWEAVSDFVDEYEEVTGGSILGVPEEPIEAADQLIRETSNEKQGEFNRELDALEAVGIEAIDHIARALAE